MTMAAVLLETCLTEHFNSSGVRRQGELKQTTRRKKRLVLICLEWSLCSTKRAKIRKEEIERGERGEGIFRRCYIISVCVCIFDTVNRDTSAFNIDRSEISPFLSLLTPPEWTDRYCNWLRGAHWNKRAV